MMSREIKFRVWDGETMRYPSSDTVITFFNGEGLVRWAMYQRMGGARIADSQYESVVMQFTGLRDREGKEIYEGDIVEAKSWSPMRYRIAFIEGGFCLTNPKMKGSPIDINLMYSSVGCACAVIGNSLENPELLQP